MDLTTLSSLRACRTLKTVVKCKFLSWPSDPVVTSCASDAQNCGKMQIFHVAEEPFRHFVRVGRSKLWQNANFSRRRATLSSLRACRTICGIYRKFFTCPGDPFVTLCVSDSQNCGKMQIFHVAEEPFRHFVRVGRSKLWETRHF